MLAAFVAASFLSAPQSLDHLLHVDDARSRRASSTSPDPNSNADNLRVAPGASHTLCELDGPGVIRHVWLTFPEARPSWLAKDGGARPDEIVLRIYWDGADTPAVEAPVGDFFACGFGERRAVRSAVVVVEDGDSYNCFWPMPFFQHAKITLGNESDKPLNSTYFHVDWEQRAVPKDTPYFCAQYHQSFPAPAGEDYLVLDAVGRGHYVGTVLSVRTRSPEWFGEGDDRFYIDGEATASIQGTGTEDYFLSAWGLQRNSMPYSGTTVLDGGWGHLGQRTTAYRWHVLDPVHFASSLRVCFEHKGWVPGDEKPDGKVHGHTERFDDFASVAFWYQIGQPHRFTALPAAKDRVPPDLDATVPGRALLATATLGDGRGELQKGPDWTGDGQVFVRAQDGAALEFPFAVPGDATGRRELIVRLTTSYDYGTWSVALDGRVVRDEVDLWSEDLGRAELMLGTQEWRGEHVLRFSCSGRDPRSRGFFFGLDSVRFRERLAPRGEPASAVPAGPAPAPRVPRALAISGSDLLLEPTQAWAEAYRNVGPRVAVAVTGGGSGRGIANLLDGTCHLAMTSRPMTAAERAAALTAGVAPIERLVASRALAVCVHRDNPIASLTLAQLARIYRKDGDLQRWLQLGVPALAGSDGTVQPVQRASSSAVALLFRSKVLGDTAPREGVPALNGSRDVVEYVAGHPGAIGFCPTPDLTAAVKAVALASEPDTPATAPTDTAIADGSYPLQQPMYLYYCDEPTGTVKAFVDWVLGDAGRDITRRSGLVPIGQ